MDALAQGHGQVDLDAPDRSFCLDLGEESLVVDGWQIDSSGIVLITLRNKLLLDLPGRSLVGFISIRYGPLRAVDSLFQWGESLRPLHHRLVHESVVAKLARGLAASCVHKSRLCKRTALISLSQQEGPPFLCCGIICDPCVILIFI